MFARYAVGDIGGYWLSGSLSGFVSLAVLYPYDVWRVLIGPQAQSIKASTSIWILQSNSLIGNLGNLTLAVQVHFPHLFLLTLRNQNGWDHFMLDSIILQ